MKYKNIIFDFGNVIGKFKGDYILGKFASTPEDYDILADAIFKNWVALDAGTIDYDQNAEDTIAGLPDHLPVRVPQNGWRHWKAGRSEPRGLLIL